MTGLDFSEHQAINLAPGHLYFGKAPAVIHTLLGSCVTITFWHSKELLGGMCHFLLASREKYQQNENHQEGYYGTDALAFFVEQINKRGLNKEDFEVKLFGGGNMFEATHHKPNTMNIASNNVEQAKQLLVENGFKLKTADVGGVRYRKIYFDLSNGDVWVKYGRHSKTEALE